MLNLYEVPAGAVVACEIFHLFDHTGIYLGDDVVVELQGSGLVRAISSNRFLDGRSGEELLVACNRRGEVIFAPEVAARASAKIYTFETYDLLQNNCHRFTYACVSGKSEPVTSFFDLKQALKALWQEDIDWRVVRR